MATMVTSTLGNIADDVCAIAVLLFGVFVFRQVDVEVVLRQVARGGAQPETIIRGQHQQLSGAMEREQRAKRQLVSRLNQGGRWK